MQFNNNSVNSISPSFTGNSSNNLADIAARVVEEFRNENGDDEDIYTFPEYQVYDEPDANRTENMKENEEEHEEEDGEFEFAVVCRNPSLSPVSADEMFSNGEIVPRYPLFDQSLLLNDDVADKYHKTDSNSNSNSKTDIRSPVVRHPLGKLFREERLSASCSSSSSAAAAAVAVDNLDGVAPGTYCIWKPKVESPERCKKSNSTGNSSKRWRLRNLLQRSNSESHMAAGKDAPVFDFGILTAGKKRSEKVKKVDKTARVAGADDDGEVTPVTVTGSKVNKGGNGIRSYLRYKKEQVLPH